MNKLNQIKQKVIHFIKQYKGYIIAFSSMVLLLIVLLLNLNTIQISYYKMNGNITSIINIISKQVKAEDEYNKLYFKTGMKYLIQDMSEETCVFLEKNLLNFNPSLQEEILNTYNQKQLFFTNHEALFHLAAKGQHMDEIKVYLKRMSSDQFEFALADYFGKDIKLSQDIVTKLYNVSVLYPNKLPLNKFQISVYDLMSFPDEGSEESIALKLLGAVDVQAARTLLFKELKTKSIDVDLFNTWVDILNRNQMITTNEYATFTNNYNGILQLREQYKQLEEQKVDLMNIKQNIDVQTGAFETKIKDHEKQIEKLNTEGERKDKALNELTRYKTMELYIMDYYGENQYEASIPEKSWFFNTYKPGSEKVTIKLTKTKPNDQGVYTFNIYDKGVGQEGIPYYVEVSAEEIKHTLELKEEIEKTLIAKQTAQNNIKVAQEEINKIRKTNNYEQNMTLLEQIEKGKENVVLRIKEYQVKVQTLFGIGNVIVETHKNKAY